MLLDQGVLEHSDSIREEGHFDRVLEFLLVLRDLGVRSKVCGATCPKIGGI